MSPTTSVITCIDSRCIGASLAITAPAVRFNLTEIGDTRPNQSTRADFWDPTVKGFGRLAGRCSAIRLCRYDGLLCNAGTIARPVWSGTVSFGLIAIPVKLFHAVPKQSVSFNQLDERNTNAFVNAATGAKVKEEQIVKGCEIAKGRYIVAGPDARAGVAAAERMTRH